MAVTEARIEVTKRNDAGTSSRKRGNLVLDIGNDSGATDHVDQAGLTQPSAGGSLISGIDNHAHHGLTEVSGTSTSAPVLTRGVEMASPASQESGVPSENSGDPRPLIDRLSTPPNDDTSDQNKQHPWVRLSEPTWAYNLAPSYSRKGGDWYQSLGTLFSPSEIDRIPGPRRAASEFHATVYARTGTEISLHLLGDVDQEMTGPDTYNFDLNLVNRVEYPKNEDLVSNIPLGRGQLVHKVVHNINPLGRNQEVDHDGPFIILDRCDTHFVLLNRQGKLYPKLVPGHCLYPCLSSWHITDIPDALLEHPDVERLRNEFRRA